MDQETRTCEKEVTERISEDGGPADGGDGDGADEDREGCWFSQEREEERACSGDVLKCIRGR